MLSGEKNLGWCGFESPLGNTVNLNRNLFLLRWNTKGDDKRCTIPNWGKISLDPGTTNRPWPLRVLQEFLHEIWQIWISRFCGKTRDDKNVGHKKLRLVKNIPFIQPWYKLQFEEWGLFQMANVHLIASFWSKFEIQILDLKVLPIIDQQNSIYSIKVSWKWALRIK